MLGYQEKGNSVWEDWYDILFQPQLAMQNISQRQSKGRALFTMMLNLCPAWLIYLSTEENISHFIGLFMGLHIVAELVIWIFGSAFLHLAAAFAGGRGAAVGLFCSLGYVGLPQLFLIPASAVAFCLSPGLRSIALIVAITVLVLWTALLKVLAIKGSYGFSTAKSILVFFSPLLVFAIFVAAGTILLGASVFSMLL